MTVDGTARCEELTATGNVPPLVAEVIARARALDFPFSVHPATGRLLAVLAGGVEGGIIGETGSGTGVGVAWMLSTACPGTRIVSIELDGERARQSAELFAGHPEVTILQGDANQLAEHGPFDLLVLDAPSTPGPLDRAVLDPGVHLTPGGVLVKDDLWPLTSWPPRTPDGTEDRARIRWLSDPRMFTTEVTVAEGYAVQIARRRPAGASP